MTRYYVRRGGKADKHRIQPPTMQEFGLADAQALLMQTQIREMGISQIRVLDDKEGYQALDERGLVKYQWRDVGELIAQIRGVDMSKEKREWIEPGIVQVNGGSFQVTATVNGKSKYGGRFSTIEEARAKRDEMLNGRKMHEHRRYTEGEVVVIHRPGQEPFVGREIPIAGPMQRDIGAPVPSPTDDEYTLIELYRAALAAKRAYHEAWFKTDELRKAMNERLAALRNFLQERGKVER